MNKIVLEDMEKIYSFDLPWERLKDQKVLITGAYGMIASYIVFMLIFLNENHDANINIYALGRSEEKMKKRFQQYMDKSYFHFIKSDLSKIEDMFISPDYIFHAASHASSQYYGTDPVGVTMPNVIGTYSILENSIRNPIKSMVYVSSGEVYGATNKERIVENDIGLSDPLDIRYCYGESKRMGECLCKCYQHQYAIPVKMVRLGHTYGPTMDLLHDKRVFAEFVKNVVNQQDIEIKSDGTPMRAFCYLADAIFGFFLVLFRGVDGQAYNIANYDGLISMRDLALCLSHMGKREIQVSFAKRPANDDYIESSQTKHNVPDTTKIEKLGWKCRYNIEEGFQRTIKSFEN